MRRASTGSLGMDRSAGYVWPALFMESFSPVMAMDIILITPPASCTDSTGQGEGVANVLLRGTGTAPGVGSGKRTPAAGNINERRRTWVSQSSIRAVPTEYCSKEVQ